MALDRLIPVSTTPGAVTGDSFMDAVSEELTGLWDRSCILLTGVGGTADVITATATPALTGSLLGGMRFILPIASNNTTAATLNINGGGPVDIVRNDGSATQAGDLSAGEKVPLLYDSVSTKFVMLFHHTVATGADVDYQSFTGSGTWTKPSGLNTSALVLVEAWGGGGGGNSGTNGGGGGGGSYAFRIFRASQLGSTETVTIGAASSIGGAGNNTTFGSLLTAYGGGAGGTNVSGGGGGGGGGQNAKGSAGSGTTGGNGGGPLGGTGGNPAIDGNLGGGGGGSGGSPGIAGAASWFGGGGAGSGYNAGAGGNGGASVYGGGGGGGDGSTTDGSGGTSIYGGAGGGGGAVAGSAPGGGGGRNAVGARGECRALVIG